MKKRVRQILTVVGWIIIGSAVIALIRFIIVSGAFK